VRINAAAAGAGTSNTVTKRIVAMAMSLRREEPARGRVKVDMKELLRGEAFGKSNFENRRNTIPELDQAQLFFLATLA
jgi:hypothetical protein